MNSAEPLVTIAIPTFGGGENLKRSIDSVINQIYTTWECVVVDDNGIGTPNQCKTAEIMQQYSFDSRIKYVCHDVNLNGSAARNTGIRSSNGEFICVLDDDDEYAPDFLSVQVPVLSELSSEYPLTYVSKADYVRGKLYSVLHVSSCDDVNLVDLFSEKFPIGACSFLMRRSAYDLVGGYDESFKRHQDWEFLNKTLATYKKARGIDKVCYKRYLTQRNNPRNSFLAKQYREHYLSKMRPYIQTLSQDDQKKIYDTHLGSLCIMYLSNKDFKLFFKDVFTNLPGKTFWKIIFRKISVILKRGTLRA